MAATIVSAAPSMLISAALSHSSRAAFNANGPKGPMCDDEPLLSGQSAALRKDDDEGLAFLDSLPCPEAPPEQAESKKRALEALPCDTERPAKARMTQEDELELLDPSTGAAAAAKYELIDGRFVETHAPSILPAEEVSCLVHVDVPQPRPDFDDLLLSKEGWRIWEESSGSADPKAFAGWKPRSKRLPSPLLRTALFSWVPRSRTPAYSWP
ncbi:hypothetical protein T484DRAFT_1935245 [Baffinella frigidus]|nr:hypothetical protein T484DRAFT_1935245 [Cryptophyta sp. CCMP2293]